MNTAIESFTAPRTASRLQLGVIILFFAAFLSGCKNYGPIGTADFDPTYSRTLERNEKLLFASLTELVEGTYMEGEEESHPSHLGVLLLTDQRMLFAIWNEKQQRYEPTLWTGYPYISQVKMHNNILLQYIAIVATDGSKFSYFLSKGNVEKAYTILMERIVQRHNTPMPEGAGI